MEYFECGSDHKNDEIQKNVVNSIEIVANSGNFDGGMDEAKMQIRCIDIEWTMNTLLCIGSASKPARF